MIETNLRPLVDVSLEERLKRVLAVIEGISLMAAEFYIADEDHRKQLLENPESLLQTALQLSKEMGTIYTITHGITPHTCCRESKWMTLVESIEQEFVEYGVMDPKEVLDSWSNENAT